MLINLEKMKNLNTKKDFVNFCYSHWYKKKDINWILKLLEMFILDSMINKSKFVLNWIFTIYKTDTTTTLREWTFLKVKIKLSEKITYLFSKKW